MWLKLCCVICNNDWDERRFLTHLSSSPCARREIAVGAILIPGHSHAGIFFKDGSGTVRLLHFGGVIECDDVPEDHEEFVWAERPLEPLQEQQLSSMCEFVSNNRAQIDIDYRFGYSPRSRIVGIHFIPADGTEGLTCSTFVNLIFRQCGAEFLDADNWGVSAEDIREREEFIRTHLRPGTRTHQRFVSELRLPRISPADLLGGYMFDKVPVGYWLTRATKPRLALLWERYYSTVS